MRKIFFILFISLSPSFAFAQMFSVGNGEEERSPQNTNNYFRIGYKPVEFTYKGDNNAILPQEDLTFSKPALTLGFESSAITGSLSIINRITGSKDESYLSLSLDYINRFAFINRPNIKIGLPINITTSLVNIAKGENNNDFSQTVFGLGTGLFLDINVGSKLNLELEGIPAYGFSNSNGGIFGGSNKSLEAKSRINFKGLLPRRNLSLGYGYKISSYDLDGEKFDYNLAHHRLTLGISF